MPLCLPCAKEIIDGAAAVNRALSCMENSILLNANVTSPTDAQADAFRVAADALVEEAAKIEAYVGASLERKALPKKKPERPVSDGGAPWKPGSGGAA